MYSQFFWLHIKKSAGLTTRNLLQPHYVEVANRNERPKCFIQAPPEEYNDILNNFRIVLGDYQFRRALFAKTYLYPNSWNDMFSFAFSRQPLERCISMFHYLFWTDADYFSRLKRMLLKSWQTKKFLFNASYAFDVFLDCAAQARASDSIYLPIDMAFTTHTAPMWEDITDPEGNVLLTRVYRLEALAMGINQAFEACGIDKRIGDTDTRLNTGSSHKIYNPNAGQKRKVEEIYGKDFEIYEAAEH